MLTSVKNLFATFVVTLVLLPAAHAAPYRTTVNGTTYDFTTITGTANDNQQLLSEQPWFGSRSLAFEFATVIWDNLGGTVNLDELGPMFAYAGDETGFSFAAYSFEYIVVPKDTFNGNVSYTFAVAQEVPQQVPEIDGALLPQALMLMGATGLFFRRRRR